jgi:hypothetical protein
MLDNLYDSYGYKQNESFVSKVDMKGLEFNPVKRVPEEFTEVESFLRNDYQENVDLVQPTICNQ